MLDKMMFEGLREQREAAGVSAVELAPWLGCSSDTVFSFEGGRARRMMSRSAYLEALDYAVRHKKRVASITLVHSVREPS